MQQYINMLPDCDMLSSDIIVALKLYTFHL